MPDFIVRLENGLNLVLEIKGQESPMDKAKRESLEVWVKAMNSEGLFGRWACDVAFHPSEVQDIITKFSPPLGQ